MSPCPSNGGNAPRVDRRLAAIAFIDIVGYSILMARDETRTHQRWMAILDTIIQYGKQRVTRDLILWSLSISGGLFLLAVIMAAIADAGEEVE